MHVFLRTDRMVMRRFTAADVDLLVELDSDPEVMRYITGGRSTPREEIERDFLPAFLGYYERFAGYGFWAEGDEHGEVEYALGRADWHDGDS